MGSRSRDRRGGGCWGPGGRTFVTPLRYTNCSFWGNLGLRTRGAKADAPQQTH